MQQELDSHLDHPYDIITKQDIVLAEIYTMPSTMRSCPVTGLLGTMVIQVINSNSKSHQMSLSHSFVNYCSLHMVSI